MSTTEELMLFGLSFAAGFIITVVAVAWSFLRNVDGKPKVFCRSVVTIDDRGETVEMVWSFLPEKEDKDERF